MGHLLVERQYICLSWRRVITQIITQAPPQSGQEQRGTFRVLSYWNRMRGDRLFPSLADISIQDIQELWPFTYTIDVQREGMHFFQHFGSELATIFNQDYTGETLAESMNDVIVDNTIGFYPKVIKAREPALEAASFYMDGSEMRYRSIIVPLSSDGETIDYVLGTTNYKAFPLSGQ